MWLGGALWRPEGRERLAATLADGRRAVVWRRRGRVLSLAGGVGGLAPGGGSLLAEAGRLAREARGSAHADSR